MSRVVLGQVRTVLDIPPVQQAWNISHLEYCDSVTPLQVWLYYVCISSVRRKFLYTAGGRSCVPVTLIDDNKHKKDIKIELFVYAVISCQWARTTWENIEMPNRKTLHVHILQARMVKRHTIKGDLEQTRRPCIVFWFSTISHACWWTKVLFLG